MSSIPHRADTLAGHGSNHNVPPSPPSASDEDIRIRSEVRNRVRIVMQLRKIRPGSLS